MTRIVKDPDERRSELIAAAQQLFFTKGYETTSVSDIVKAVGVAKGTFYYYFDSKLAILQALMADVMTQVMAVMQEVIDDGEMPALKKWNHALQVTGSWKTTRKEELIHLLRVMQKDENIILQHWRQKETMRVLAPAFAQIITQGVAEGVFSTDYPTEAAEMVIATLYTFNDSLADLILNPEKYDNSLAIAQRKLAAMGAAIERILGAPQGSLTFVDQQILTAWFV
jgi:AcrR family transcriptional regulator